MTQRELLEHDIMLMLSLMTPEEQEEVYELFVGYILRKAHSAEWED